MYTQKDFTHLLGTVGFSDSMLTNHMTLYGGYVANANKMLENMDKAEKGSQEYYELKRRLGWEVNGIKLHDLYFGNITKNNIQDNTLKSFENLEKNMGENKSIKSVLIESYSSIENFESSLKRNGMIRGIGWVLLIQDLDTRKVFHTWVAEHNTNIILGAKILMVMDMWEHAYMTDYGIKKADYINAFINAIDWDVVESRYNSK